MTTYKFSRHGLMEAQNYDRYETPRLIVGLSLMLLMAGLTAYTETITAGYTAPIKLGIVAYKTIIVGL